MTTQNEKSPAPEQASEEIHQRTETKETAETILGSDATQSNQTDLKSGVDVRRTDPLTFEITEQMAAECTDRNDLENVLTSFSTQRNAIEDVRTLYPRITIFLCIGSTPF